MGGEKIIINEYMLNNTCTIRDEELLYPGWIELYNKSTMTVHLKGFGLTHSEYIPFYWKFPDINMKGHSYLIIFISGKDRVFYHNRFEKAYIHTNFTLTDKNNSIYISTPRGTLIDRVMVKESEKDISWQRIKGSNEDTWIMCDYPTPGFNNTYTGYGEFHRQKEKEKQDVYINEIMASNSRTLIDDDGGFSDWIELYNSSDVEYVPLKNYGLSDDRDTPLKWTFPDVVLLPGQYLVVFASGMEVTEGEQIYVHTNFRLNAGAEQLLFCDPEGLVLDKVAINGHQPDVSYGRDTGNHPEWTYFTGATPGYKNDWDEYQQQEILKGMAPLFFLESSTGGSFSTGCREKAGKVKFSYDGGYFTEPLFVELFSSADKIVYTLDGSKPDENSYLYTSPIFIDRTTVIRARGITQGTPLDEVTTCSFFFNITHELPVISLVTDPENLWNPGSGILAPENIEKNIEKPVHIEFFETNGQTGFHLDAGIRLFGHSSRLLPQRPFYILTRKRYGQKTIKYRIFPDKDIRIYKSILLRNGGEDGRYSRIRDTLTHTLVRELGIDAQASRPVVVYLNGEYRGQYFLRDKIDEYFLAYHHNIPSPLHIDLIEGNGNVMSGSYTAFHNLEQYISTHDVRKPEVYSYVKTQIDIDNLIHYELAQIYFANTDMGNIRFWRERSPRGKWRWILFDTDWSLFVAERNAFKYNLDPGGRGYLKYFSTLIITSLLKNGEFKTKFIRQCIHLLNTTFSSGHVCALIEKIVGTIEKEMPAHCKRWQVSLEEWERQVERVREFARKRPAYVREHLKSYFGLSEAEYELLAD